MLHNPRSEFFQLLSQGLKPQELLTLQDWSGKYRYLTSKSSPEPGKYNPYRTPFLIEIMNDLSLFSPVKEIYFMKGAQIGATEMGCSWIGYIMDLCSGSLLYVLPTLKSAKKMSRQRIGPMIKASPSLNEKIRSSAGHDPSNSMLYKEWHQGTLTICGSNSSSELKSSSVPYLFVDEYDAMKSDLDEQGDVVSLCMVRSRNFERRKIFVCSTPTTEEGSLISKLFLETNQKHYFVPCQYCGIKSILKWENIKWPSGKPRQAVWECPNCAKSSDESAKAKMLLEGEWRATNPLATDPEVMGYHLSALYSPWYKWVDAAKEFTKAGKNLNKLKTFINTSLAETWKDRGIVPDWKRLYERREHYKPNTLPDGVMFITCGVDLSKTFAAIEIKGYGENKQSWSIDFRIIEGDPYQKEIWKKLDDLLNETWELKNGIKIPIRLLAIDSGNWTQICYSWVRKQNPHRVIAIKGIDNLNLPIGMAKPVDNVINGKTYYRSLKLWKVGVSMLKHEIYGFLQLEKPTKEKEPFPTGYMHFPEYDEDYFKSLTGEQCLEVIKKNGTAKWEWVRTIERQEVLDCTVYSFACAYLIGWDLWKGEQWESLKRELKLDSKTDKIVQHSRKRRYTIT